jgi:hypothetical protein
MRKRSLDDQEQHVALVMLTSKRLTREGRGKETTQNNNKAKTEQLKLSKTYR